MYFALRRRPIGADALNGDLTVDVAYTDSMIDHVSRVVGNTIYENYFGPSAMFLEETLAARGLQAEGLR